MANLVLVVNVTVAPEQVDTFLPLILENAAQSIKEQGCLQFDVIVNRNEANKFQFYEVYTGPDALDRHRQTPHFKAYFAAMEALGDGFRREAQLYDKIS